MYYEKKVSKLQRHRYAVERFFRWIKFWIPYLLSFPSEIMKHFRSDEWKEECRKIDEKWKNPELKSAWRQGGYFGFVSGAGLALWTLWFAVQLIQFMENYNG